MLQSLHLDQRGHADLTFCSWEHGWRSLLLRRFTGHSQVEEAVIDPVEEQAVVLVTRGLCHIESSSGGRWRSARYTPGVVAMTAPNRPTRLRWRPMSPVQSELDHETLHLYLPGASISRAVQELWDRDPAQVTLPDSLATTDPLLEQLMLALLRAAEVGVPDLYAETAAELVAVHTLVRHGALPLRRSFPGNDGRIWRARSFLRENLHLPLTLAEIADEAGMSRFHFLRAFRAATGETPHRYLTRLRIECAQDELVRTSLAVGEIARRCGFVSPSHFAVTFRRWTGDAPNAYRRLHRS